MSSFFSPSPPPTSSYDDYEEISRGVVILTLVLVGIFKATILYCGVKCYCDKRAAKRARIALVKDLVQELRLVVALPDPLPHPHYAVQIWEMDAPTMEKFLREFAEEKPVRFTAQQLKAFTRNYSTRLGSGGFGTVYKGKFPNGVNIAVKVLQKSSQIEVGEQFMAEVGTIGRTYHINLVRLYGFCYDQHTSAVVYEFMENGSLDKYLFVENELLDWRKLHDIAIGTAKGIAYLHEECQQRIIHYDIKPGNILLDSKFSPKVADFGLAKLCNRENTHISEIEYRGTPGYIAPEFNLRNHPITYKCDVYSFGMVLFEILGRRKNTTAAAGFFPSHVWEKYDKGELVGMIETFGIEDKEKAERLSMVALWCIQDLPEARPPMSAIVKMLEGGVDIMPPSKPFHYLYSFGMNEFKPSISAANSKFSSCEENNSHWYKEATTVMAKYEIQLASS